MIQTDSKVSSKSDVSTRVQAPAGKCVVCGIKTHLRCLPCSLHPGTKWMYFCSKQHQLLVWPLHRRVCGKQSFTWPALTQKEIDEMIDMSTKPARGFDGLATTWLETLKASFEKEVVWMKDPAKVKQVPIVFKRLLASKRERSNGSSLDALELPGLVGVRAQAWRVRLTSTYFDREPTFEESLRLLVQHPFDFLAYLESSRMGDLALALALNLDNSRQWSSDLQHRNCLLLALICAAPRRGFPSKEYYQVEGYRVGVYSETVRYCQEVIKPLDSDMADYIVSNVVTLLGLPFPEDASRVEAELKRTCGGVKNGS